MTTQSAIAMQPVSRTESVRQSKEDILNQLSTMYDLIAQRAFEICETRGGMPGHEGEDWLRAESELLHPVPANITELDGQYTVRAEVPGFSSRDIEISAEPYQLVISGKRETIEQQENGQTIRSEWHAERILRAVDLPSRIDTSKVSSNLKDGILTVDAPKTRDEN